MSTESRLTEQEQPRDVDTELREIFTQLGGGSNGGARAKKMEDGHEFYIWDRFAPRDFESPFEPFREKKVESKHHSFLVRLGHITYTSDYLGMITLEGLTAKYMVGNQEFSQTITLRSADKTNGVILDWTKECLAKDKFVNFPYTVISNQPAPNYQI
jgi:hypothetical protein